MVASCLFVFFDPLSLVHIIFLTFFVFPLGEALLINIAVLSSFAKAPCSCFCCSHWTKKCLDMCPTSVTVNCAGYVAWKHKNTVVFIGLWRWAEQTKHATHAKMLYRILHAALLELFVRWNPISGIYSGERGRKDTRKRTTKFISSPSTASVQTHLKTRETADGWAL